EARWIDALGDGAAPAFAIRRARLFLDAGDPERALALTEPLREAHRDARRVWADAMGAVGDPALRARELESLAESATDGSERRALLAEAARSHLDAEDLPLALDAAHRADAPDADGESADPALRALVAEIAWRSRAWDEVAELHRALLPTATGALKAEY